MRIFSLLGFRFSFGNSHTCLLTGPSRLRHLHAPVLKLEVPNSARIPNTPKWRILGIGSNRIEIFAYFASLLIFAQTSSYTDITATVQGVKRHMSQDVPSTKCDLYYVCIIYTQVTKCDVTQPTLTWPWSWNRRDQASRHSWLGSCRSGAPVAQTAWQDQRAVNPNTLTTY